MSDVVLVKECKNLNSNTYQIVFHWDREPTPGQFVMVWKPGMDEIPISLSSTRVDKSITFKVIGRDTEELSRTKSGDHIQIRGPYGNGYRLDINDKKRILVVGGGIGIAPLLPVIKYKAVDAVIASASAEEVLTYKKTAKNYCKKVWTATDDGTEGFHGNAVDLVKQILKEEYYDEIIACGPEVMLFFLHQYLNKVHVEHQMSLERYMKCGCGICGACMIDNKRVCRDGPVFDNYEIDKLKEFGVSKRDIDGSLVLFRKP